MFVDDLNNILPVRINKNDIKRILDDGEIGLYQTIVMHRFTGSINGKYVYECNEEEINSFVKRNIDFLKKKYKHFFFYTMSENINEDFINLLNHLPNEISILVEIKDLTKTDFNLITRIINDFKNRKIYFKDNIREYTTDALLYLTKLLDVNKLVKFGWSNERSAELYMLDDLKREDNLVINIENVNDPKVVAKELYKLKQLFQRDVLENVTINIEITNIRVFKVLGNIIESFEQDDEWPYDKIKFNLNVDKIDKQITHSASNFGSFSHLESAIFINAQGIQYNSYGEYGNFQKYVNFVLGKVPATATELEKVVYVSKFIVENFHYDDAHYENKLAGEGGTPIRSMAEFASHGIGVCRDYARLTEYLLNRLGVRCEYISSNTYAYEEDVGISGKIKYGKTGEIMDSKYIGHAFNIVYIDNQPYFIDNTWLSKGQRIYNSPNMLVSTENFLKTHGEYVEVKKYDCPSDYDRYDILDAERWVERYWLSYTKEEIAYLYQMGIDNLANNIKPSSAPKF